jgi:hypothetical protein
MMKIVVFFTMVITILAAAFLFRVKHEVLAIEKKIGVLQKSIAHIEAESNLLHSELAYLTQPQRILHLGQTYLNDLKTLSPQQLVPNPLKVRNAP